MKALKLTIEVPLNDKSHAGDMRKIGVLADEFQETLQKIGFKGVTVSEAIVTRPGRG